MHGFTVPQAQYVNPGTNDNAAQDRYAKMDMALTQAVAATCETHYPGHPWRIEVTHEQQIIKIQLAPFMGPSLWYKIGIPGVPAHELERRVRHACGEILERFQVPRSKFSLDHFLAARSAAPLHRKSAGWIPA